MKLLGVISLELLLTALSSTVSAAATCESLAALTLPDTTITLAKSEPAGTFTPSKPFPLPAPPLDNLPAFCRVAGEIKPTRDSDIKFEVWMPAADWNGKFMGIGNGGWSGEIWYPFMGVALRRGYATASTDTGHEGNGGDASRQGEGNRCDLLRECPQARLLERLLGGWETSAHGSATVSVRF